jgi:hypothetical protein
LTDIVEVTSKEYTEVKFGRAWRSTHSPYNECIRFANREYLTCHFEASAIFRHDREGKKVHQYNIAPLQTGFDTIYSITIDKEEHLWITQPSSHYIGQYDLDTEKLLFSIGGDYNNPDTFNYPEQIRAYGDYVYISDMGNNRICQLRIDTKELIDYKRFDEQVWEYEQFKGKELARLQSGLIQSNCNC